MEKGMKKELTITVNTSEIDRLAIGARLYDALKGNAEAVNFHTIIDYDRQRKCYKIKETEMLKLIELVNRISIPDAHVELVKE